MTKRTEITIETDQVLVIRRRRKTLRTWCAACARKVVMVTADEAAAVAHVSLRTLYRWVESCTVHFTETQEGLLFVCLDSLYPRPHAADAAPARGYADRSCNSCGGMEQIGQPLAGDGSRDQFGSAIRHLALPMLRTCRRILSGLY
ncbi:MAG TPA: hypothetical protein VJZ26_08545 [Blastocatellia bacterium]|nr:hypothetical protein [Blastocatellia bacterium]